jgi:hypothetical protein
MGIPIHHRSDMIKPKRSGILTGTAGVYFVTSCLAAKGFCAAPRLAMHLTLYDRIGAQLNDPAMVDARGFVFDTKSHPRPGNGEPIFSGYAYQVTECGQFGRGEYSADISGLTPNTTYFCRACAHNVAGWSYSDNETSFTTKKAGLWYEITSSFLVEGVEVGFPSGVKVKLKKKD